MATDTFNNTAADSTAAAKPSLQDQAAPYLDKAKTFVKANRFASAAAAGVIGLALLNTLRGK